MVGCRCMHSWCLTSSFYYDVMVVVGWVWGCALNLVAQALASTGTVWFWSGVGDCNDITDVSVTKVSQSSQECCTSTMAMVQGAREGEGEGGGGAEPERYTESGRVIERERESE